MPLTDGTYFINRWFATLESIPKTIIPIGYVGVIVSYCGRTGQDLSGLAFRHGERVAEGERGVQEKPLGPGKYAFNTYAGNIVLVPTTNFVLHWVTGRTEAHRYDESLRSIDLVTKDAYEPTLPLSVVVHIDYQKAPGVIQRFGDVKKLITQTLDPMLSAYFRDVAHKRTMLELLQERDSIQKEASQELSRKFHNFDIECVDVLIGKPDTNEAGGKIETLLEQLRLRQLSIEQVETYAKQVQAAEKLRVLNEAQANASMQTKLTNSLVQVRIVENEAEAQLAKARKEAEQKIVTAQAESQQRILAGRGEGARILQEGLSEASVLVRKIQSFTDPRLYALSVVAQNLARSSQPLVPERVFIAGGAGGNGHSADGLPTAASATAGSGLLGMLLSLLVAEKSGFDVAGLPGGNILQEFADKVSKQAMENIQAAMAAGAVEDGAGNSNLELPKRRGRPRASPKPRRQASPKPKRSRRRPSAAMHIDRPARRLDRAEQHALAHAHAHHIAVGVFFFPPPPQNPWVGETPIGQLLPGFSAGFDTFGGRRLSYLKSKPGKEPFMGVNSDVPSYRAGAEPAPRFPPTNSAEQPKKETLHKERLGHYDFIVVLYFDREGRDARCSAADFLGAGSSCADHMAHG